MAWGTTGSGWRGGLGATGGTTGTATGTAGGGGGGYACACACTVGAGWGANGAEVLAVRWRARPPGVLFAFVVDQVWTFLRYARVKLSEWKRLRRAMRTFGSGLLGSGRDVVLELVGGIICCVGDL